jgi:hypothetical protein
LSLTRGGVVANGPIPFSKKWKEQWYEFLSVLRLSGNVSEAERKTGIRKRDMYGIRDTSPERLKEWTEALEDATNSLITEATRRARDGVTEDVWYNGDVVGSKIRYSDTLLMFLIKGQCPQYATERREISGPNGGAIPIPPLSLTHLEDDELKSLLALARKIHAMSSEEKKACSVLPD